MAQDSEFGDVYCILPLNLSKVCICENKSLYEKNNKKNLFQIYGSGTHCLANVIWAILSNPKENAKCTSGLFGNLKQYIIVKASKKLLKLNTRH